MPQSCSSHHCSWAVTLCHLSTPESPQGWRGLWAKETLAIQQGGGSQPLGSESITHRWQQDGMYWFWQLGLLNRGRAWKRNFSIESSRFLLGCRAVHVPWESEMMESGSKMKASMAFCKEMMFHTGTAVPGLSETSREAKFGELGAANVAGPCCPVCQLPPSFCSGLPPLLHFCLDVTSLPCTSVAPVTYTTRREKAEPGKHREQIPPRLVLQHAGIWLPSSGAPGPLRGKGQAMSGSLPSLQGCSTLPPPLPPSLPPAAFLAPSGERCWESNTTGPIQLSLLPGEQTPAQELGSRWTAGGHVFPSFFAAS